MFTGIIIHSRTLYNIINLKLTQPLAVSSQTNACLITTPKQLATHVESFIVSSYACISCDVMRCLFTSAHFFEIVRSCPKIAKM